MWHQNDEVSTSIHRDSLLLKIRTRYEFDFESVILFSICEGVKDTVECFMWWQINGEACALHFNF